MVAIQALKYSEAEGYLVVQSQAGLYNKYQASQEYTASCCLYQSVFVCLDPHLNVNNFVCCLQDLLYVQS